MKTKRDDPGLALGFKMGLTKELVKHGHDSGLAYEFQQLRKENRLFWAFFIWFFATIITAFLGIIGIQIKSEFLTIIGFLIAGTGTICYIIWLAAESFD